MPSRPISILLVEDNPSDAALVEAQLSQSNVEVKLECSETLDGAVQQMRRTRFDVVLLDLTLPDSQGLATFKLLHAVAGRTPIIVLTGLEGMEVGVQALSDGAQDFLLKSKIDSDSLIRSIRYTLERNRRQHAESELRAAGVIQRKLFPRKTPKATGFDINGRCTQATFAGGDFFDFFSMGRTHLGVVIGDAAGHGIGPAITMSETRAVIRAFASVTHDVGQILTRSGTILSKDLTKETFVALFLARIDIASSTLQFATAGHPGFVLATNGRMKQLLKSDAPPLGVDPTAVYESSPDIALESGDALFLFTDGFAEGRSPGGEHFGKQRIFESIREGYSKGADAMLNQLFERFSAFRQGAHPEDDVTAVIVKASPREMTPALEPIEDWIESSEPGEESAAGAYEHFVAEKHGDVALLRIREEEVLSSQMCAEIKAELVDYIGQEQPLRVILSFLTVRRFSSEGINICFQVKSAMENVPGQLRLCDMNPQLREAFKALNLDGTVFEIHDNTDKALSSF